MTRRLTLSLATALVVAATIVAVVFVGAPPTLADKPRAAPGLSAVEKAARQPVLGLDDNTIARCVAYVGRIESLKTKPEGEAFCAARAEARALLQVLAEPLFEARERAWDQDLDAYVKAVDALSAAMPGMRLAYGAETVYVELDGPALAAFAPHKQRAAIEAASAFTGGSWPVYYEQVTDLQACVTHDHLKALKKLRATLGDLGPCLRAQLMPDLKQALSTAANASWFCELKPKATAQADAWAKEVSTWTAVDGAALAKAARAAVRAKDARFGRDQVP
jgi:hypothetical protein